MVTEAAAAKFKEQMTKDDLFFLTAENQELVDMVKVDQILEEAASKAEKKTPSQELEESARCFICGITKVKMRNIAGEDGEVKKTKTCFQCGRVVD